MNEKRLESFKLQLLDRQRELLSAIARAESDGREAEASETQDSVDKANSTYAKETLFQKSTADRALLNLVEDALRRVDEGEYGKCVECGQPVEDKRLDAVPWAPLCMRCQELKERQLL